MGTKVIPEKVIKICDCCGKEVQKFDGKFTYHEPYRDFSGAVVNGKTHDLDLCESCADKIFREIKK